MLYESPNFRVALDDGTAALWLDCRSRKANAFDPGLLDEFDRVLGRLRAVPALAVLAVRSSRPGSFLGDHDAAALRDLSADDVRAYAARGQQTLQKLADLGPNVRTVAVVDGACVGAGLELALACDYRFAVVGPDVTFALPSVRRGLVPFWGGTYRLPRVVGPRRAAELLLDGTALTAEQARVVGLVDRTACPRAFRADYEAFLESVREAGRKPARRVGLGGTPPARWASAGRSTSGSPT